MTSRQPRSALLPDPEKAPRITLPLGCFRRGMLQFRTGRRQVQKLETVTGGVTSGSVHGGYMATMLDAAMALALQTVIPAGTRYSTTDLRVTYVRALTKEVGRVRAEGTVLHVGRSLAVAEAKLLDANDRLYAHGTATLRIQGAG
jgi:uncharacterized protein (TIGR00369 family)